MMSNNNNANITNMLNGVETPPDFRGQQVTDTILNALNLDNNTNDDNEPNAKWAKYVRLTPDQLSSIVTAC